MTRKELLEKLPPEVIADAIETDGRIHILPDNHRKAFEGLMPILVRVQAENAEFELNEAKKAQSAFMVILKATNIKAYKAMQKALDKYVFYENGKFDFRCKKGSVGMFFKKVGYFGIKDRDIISQYVTIYGQPVESNSIENANRNAPPGDWPKIEADIFTTK
jgi:hypothetical protein